MLPTKRPSLEAALARMAPALTSLEHRALTVPLLGTHTHWLRTALHIHRHSVVSVAQLLRPSAL